MTLQTADTTIRWKKLTLAVAAAGLAANALAMLADPLGWYNTVGGVADTGPFNPHFVRDIGVAYLTCALCAAAAATWLRQAFTLMSAVTLFLGLHVGLHIWDVAAGRLHLDHLLIDAPGVLGPTIVTGLLVWWTRTNRA
jgi:hypothetical protein